VNRAQRRAKLRGQKSQLQAATHAVNETGRIPVFSGRENRLVDTIAPWEVEHYRLAVNSHVILDEAGRPIRIVLDSHSDDTEMVVHRGNPRRYSHDHENEQNPPRVWTLRRLVKRDRDIYRSSVLDCIAPERKKVVAIDVAIAKAERKLEKLPTSRRRRENVRTIDALRAERKTVVAPLVERLKQVYEAA
jgi:hypothetical protein